MTKPTIAEYNRWSGESGLGLGLGLAVDWVELLGAHPFEPWQLRVPEGTCRVGLTAGWTREERNRENLVLGSHQRFC